MYSNITFYNIWKRFVEQVNREIQRHITWPIKSNSKASFHWKNSQKATQNQKFLISYAVLVTYNLMLHDGTQITEINIQERAKMKVKSVLPLPEKYKL